MRRRELLGWGLLASAGSVLAIDALSTDTDAETYGIETYSESAYGSPETTSC